MYSSEKLILDAFATFYERFYTTNFKHDGSTSEKEDQDTAIPDISTEGVKNQIKELRNDKAADRRELLLK